MCPSVGVVRSVDGWGGHGRGGGQDLGEGGAFRGGSIICKGGSKFAFLSLRGGQQEKNLCLRSTGSPTQRP